MKYLAIAGGVAALASATAAIVVLAIIGEIGRYEGSGYFYE